MNPLRYGLLTIVSLCLFLSHLPANQSRLISTESDPDAFIQDCVNVINGDYCESVTDLVIPGPDPLILQRFYSLKNTINGKQTGGWRILPQRFLVIGNEPPQPRAPKDPEEEEWLYECKAPPESTSAFVGERSGGILQYKHWTYHIIYAKRPLQIDLFKQSIGMVNTYTKEINGQNNHRNNLLYYKDNQCELILGDGTKRIYKRVETVPTLLLGEELIPEMAAQLVTPSYFLLSQEILPSGNQIFFSYDGEGRLTSMELKNKTLLKILSWMHFSYAFHDSNAEIRIETSDSRVLTYHVSLKNDAYSLVKVDGSHCLPVTYEYNDTAIKKVLPEGRFVEIEYQDGKVKSLKGPHHQSGNSEIVYSFAYGQDYTDVFNTIGVRTRYRYDKRFQLTAIERYDAKNRLYRVEQKFWGQTVEDVGLLLAKTIKDGSDRTLSYRSFRYDKAYNVIEEKLYGNLTENQEVFLEVSPEGKIVPSYRTDCHSKSFEYSTDGLNVLTKMGDCKENQTRYIYKSGSNQLIKKFIYNGGIIRNRTFQSYNDDGVCTKIIEDDGKEEDEFILTNVSERHIKEITPKETLPGIGLPEVIQEKALDLKSKQEILVKRLVNTYTDQSQLLSCSTYDANNQYAFTEKKRYDAIGQVIAQVDKVGKATHATYDAIGNQITSSIPQENKIVMTRYDFHNQPIEITQQTADTQWTIRNEYDSLSRKTCSIDRFGNPTYYEYDTFNRLTKVIHPAVYDENNQVIRPTFRYTYDIFGNVLTIEDPQGFITTKEYNLRGSPTKILYPDESCELFKYDPEGSLHRSFTREQTLTVYNYDYLGRPAHEGLSFLNGLSTHPFSLLKSKNRQYNGFRCIQENDYGYSTLYKYDPAGRITAIQKLQNANREQDPESQLTEMFYDPLGRLVKKKVWFNKQPQDYSLECFEYDLSGNILLKRIEDDQGKTLLRKGFSYDTTGNCIHEYSFENGKQNTIVTNYYNGEGELISSLDALGYETKVILDTCYQNVLGQKVLKKTVVNAIGVQTEIEFDALNRVCAISKKDASGLHLSSQKIFYDGVGNKTCEINDQIVDGTIIESQKTRWIYGPMGRLDEEIEAADSPLEKRTFYSYNSLGKMVKKSFSGVSEALTYTYDKVGRLERVEAQNDKEEKKISNSYSYDPNGNVIAATSLPGISVQREYNVFGQLIKETINNETGYSWNKHRSSYSLRYAYDRKGRLTEVTLPDYSKIAYTYDALFGRKVSRISDRGEICYTHTYDQYDNQGRLLSECHIYDVGTETYTYDSNGQKIGHESYDYKEQYIRDPLGRLVKVTRTQPYNKEAFPASEKYTYNSLSQLTQEKKGITKTHQYDSLDNRINEDTNQSLYNPLNQLISDSQTNFEYDKQGNLLKRTEGGEETHFESNLLSQLVSISKADKSTATFSYDPFGRVLIETYAQRGSCEVKTQYFYIGYQEIGSLLSSCVIDSLKIPGLQGNELSSKSIAFEFQEIRYAPMHDIVGNVIEIKDLNNRYNRDTYRYTAFGENCDYSNLRKAKNYNPYDRSNPWRFAEKRMSRHSGLILFGLRFYDPSIGRWISQDPARHIDGPNLYAYVHSNPINNFDRFGLSTESASQSKLSTMFYSYVETHCACAGHRTCRRGGDIWKTAGASLPKITYDDDFEKMNQDYYTGDAIIKNYYEESKCYKTNVEGLPDLPSNLGIGFINGVWNSFEDANASAEYVARMAGYNIHGVYNATHGKGVDVRESKLGMKYIATEPVHQLHNMWNSFFDKNSGQERFLIFCHSQGAIHVRNALLDYPPALRERILVVAIAPAAYIYRRSCADIIHYRASPLRDFIPRINSHGARICGSKIRDLESHPMAEIIDHEFASPTYQMEIKKHINSYLRANGSSL